MIRKLILSALVAGAVIVGVSAMPARTLPVALGAPVADGTTDADSHTVSARDSRRERQARSLALRFYQPFNHGDVAALDTVVSEDWIDVPLAEGQQPGREGFKPIVGYFRSVFPDLQVTQEAVIVAERGTLVTVRSLFTGTQRLEFLGVPATDARISFRTTDVHRIQDGLIVETWHLEDLFGAYQQMLAASGA